MECGAGFGLWQNDASAEARPRRSREDDCFTLLVTSGTSRSRQTSAPACPARCAAEPRGAPLQDDPVVAVGHDEVTLVIEDDVVGGRASLTD